MASQRRQSGTKQDNVQEVLSKIANEVQHLNDMRRQKLIGKREFDSKRAELERRLKRLIWRVV